MMLREGFQNAYAIVKSILPSLRLLDAILHAVLDGSLTATVFFDEFNVFTFPDVLRHGLDRNFFCGPRQGIIAPEDWAQTDLLSRLSTDLGYHLELHIQLHFWRSYAAVNRFPSFAPVTMRSGRFPELYGT